MKREAFEYLTLIKEARTDLTIIKTLLSTALDRYERCKNNPRLQQSAYLQELTENIDMLRNLETIQYTTITMLQREIDDTNILNRRTNNGINIR